MILDILAARLVTAITAVLLFALLASACAFGDSAGPGPASSSSQRATPSDTTDANPVTAPTSTSTPSGDSTTSTAEPPPTTISYVEDELRLSVPNQPSQLVVGLYGDSLLDSVREHVLFNLRSGGRIDVRDDRIFSGSSLCIFLPSLRQDFLAGNMWGAVIWFSGNTLAPCTHVFGERSNDPVVVLAQLERELDEIGTLAGQAGIRVWLPDFAATRGGTFLGDGWEPGLNAMIAAVAERHSMVEVVHVAEAVLDANGNYAETLPCLPDEPCLLVDDEGTGVNFVREPDGAHFCTGGFSGAGLEAARWGTCPTYSSGAVRVARAMTKPILEAAFADWSANPTSQFPPVTLPQLADG